VADDVRGDDALVGGEAVVDVEGRPRALLLVLADHGRVLRGRALRRLVEFVRVQPEDVDAAEQDGPPDRRLRPEPGAEDVTLAVDAELAPGGAVDHEERRGAGRRLPDAARGVRLLRDRLPRG